MNSSPLGTQDYLTDWTSAPAAWRWAFANRQSILDSVFWVQSISHETASVQLAYKYPLRDWLPFQLTPRRPLDDALRLDSSTELLLTFSKRLLASADLSIVHRCCFRQKETRTKKKGENKIHVVQPTSSKWEEIVALQIRLSKLSESRHRQPTLVALVFAFAHRRLVIRLCHSNKLHSRLGQAPRPCILGQGSAHQQRIPTEWPLGSRFFFFVPACRGP